MSNLRLQACEKEERSAGMNEEEGQEEEEAGEVRVGKRTRGVEGLRGAGRGEEWKRRGGRSHRAMRRGFMMYYCGISCKEEVLVLVLVERRCN